MDSDSSLISFVSAETSLMNLYLKQRKVEKIKMSPQTDGTTYPLLQIPADKLYLPSFAWFDYIRPLDKYDLFEWRGKRRGEELKYSSRKQSPLQSF